MWFRKVAAVIAALVAGFGYFAVRESGQSAGDDSPEHIEANYRELSLVCLLPPLCPVTSEALAAMKGSVAGQSGAEYDLALILLTGEGLPEDREAGVAWMARTAEQGEPDAARDVAGRLRNGENVTVDERKIADALQTRVDAGDAEAMRALGPMIIRGRGAKADPAAGLAMMSRAFDLGSVGAASDLAQIYILGAPGVPSDRSQFLKWMEAGARRGDSEAMLSIGYAAMNSPGPASDLDLTTSYCWLVRAALIDNPRAQEQLSLNFTREEADERGVRIGADLVQADYWFRLAARSPYHDNSQIRGAIEPKMTSDDLDAAKRLVAAWRPRNFDELRTLPIALPPAKAGDASQGNCPPIG
jgi:hypothetical protein